MGCRVEQIQLYTYIHNWSLQPFSQDYGLASHTTHVVWVNFILEWRGLQFDVDSEWQILWENFSSQFMSYSQRFCQKSAERKSLKKYFFRISFWCLTGDTNPGFTANKSTHYLLDHGDFSSVTSETKYVQTTFLSVTFWHFYGKNPEKTCRLCQSLQALNLQMQNWQLQR